ncbi:MAG: DoxX family protein [Polaribacter sp.]|nr:DoxX family protein [Polaribacter sp.]
MELIGYLTIALKIIVGISILNVWLLRKNKATKWRGGTAKNIFEEFQVYGFSKQFCYFIGFLKVSLAIVLLASIQFKTLTLLGALGLSLLLVGSVIMHIRIKDAWYKSFPAFLFLIMNLMIAYTAL